MNLWAILKEDTSGLQLHLSGLPGCQKLSKINQLYVYIYVKSDNMEIHITQPSLWICHGKATFIYTPRITVFWFAFDSSFI